MLLSKYAEAKIFTEDVEQHAYTYNYNKQKLMNYYYHLKKDWYRRGKAKRERKIAKEEILGDTVFMTVPQFDCYKNHCEIVEMIETYGNGRPDSWWQGWLICDRDINGMYEEVKKVKGKRKESVSMEGI